MYEMLKRYGRQELALILVLICAVAIAPISTYLVWPQYKNPRAVSASHSALTAAATAAGDLETQIERTRAEVRELERYLHGDLAGLPAKELTAYTVGRLQSISWQNRVELVGVEPMEGEDIESFHELLFRVRLTGDYFDLYNWLRDLSRELGFIVIKQYEMAPTSLSDQNPRLRAELTIAAYRTSNS